MTVLTEEEYIYIQSTLEGLSYLKCLHDKGFNVAKYPSHTSNQRGWPDFSHHLIFIEFLRDMKCPCYCLGWYENKKQYRENERVLRKLAKRCGFSYKELAEYNHVFVLPKLHAKSIKKLQEYLKHFRYVFEVYRIKHQLVIVSDEIECLSTEELQNITTRILTAYRG